MNRSVAAVLIAFLAWGAAPAFPQTKQMPQTPTQGAADGSVKGAKLPPLVTYEAMLQKVRGTLPARLGAWSCANAVCTLRVSGADTSRAKAIDACKSFLRTVKDHAEGLRFELYKFRVNTTTSLTDAELANCKK